MYADYSYYSKVYHGKLSEMIIRPTLKKRGRILITGRISCSRKMVCLLRGSSLARRLMTCSCAIADEYYRTETGAAYSKTSEKVGEYSVSYASGDVKSADERLHDIAELYIPDVLKAVKWI